MTNFFSDKTANNLKNDLPVTLGLIAVIIFFIASGFISYRNIDVLDQNTALVTHTHEVILAVDDLLSIMKDAETGQRGFLITGDEKYLAPYEAALTRIDERMNDLERLTLDNKQVGPRLSSIRNHIHTKLKELSETISLRQTQGFDAARAVVITDRGKNDMNILREQIRLTRVEQQALRAQRIAEMNKASHIAIISGLLTGLLGIVLSGFVTALVRNASVIRNRQEWLQNGQVGLNKSLLGEQHITSLGDNLIRFLAAYLNAHAGAFFSREGDGYRRVALYGAPVEGGQTPERFFVGEGLLGQAARDGQIIILKDVPENYLAIGSALGQGVPRHLIIATAATDGAINAVLELGFMHPPPACSMQLLENASETIGIAVKSANYRAHLQNLLEETQRQSEELQAQSEELRVTNEELEEQGRVLKESQTRLEQQQAEMEQTNAQLEEQTQLLEGQRDDLARAKNSVQLKAQELEQASQYKSDFLANMSHELRTPLNSSLILAKLLADNPAGNLSDEQVKFAQTIQSSGNDLLSLINDILDLSKIEAGHVEIRPENVHLERMIKDLSLIFEPLTKQKNLTLKMELTPGCPDSIETDRQRLEQILKNLLSNAIKFTEKGDITLHIGKAPNRRVTLNVTDTGIGIANDQQQAIFEAFRQADGTISRKYGGTGLGLSISRELTRLLGGTIELKSQQGKGSSFIVTLPENFDPAKVEVRVPAAPAQTISEKKPSEKNMPARKDEPPQNLPLDRDRIQDDRENLSPGNRVILVIEDDKSFARILYDLAHELEFRCIITSTAEDGLAAAVQYLPDAVVLDVGLPDNSGLSVLDRLKQNVRTRHIPVHVVSAGDHAQTALSLGAIGYLLKPVKREELVDSLRRLETRLAQRMRRVLIVEDDDVQRDSVGKLLGSHEVETVGVGTAAECLAQLKESTFDCMVLDLTLPDTTGYALLETLSRERAYSFPPVIVYTGRDLSTDEEQRLRRYSKSIIIKGAKSPERLLDEVTLFLHQVVSDLPPEQQKMLERSKNRDAVLEGRHILVVEDDVANIYALTSILEPHGALVHIARNGREAIEKLEAMKPGGKQNIDLVLMDMMMPEMDGLTATKKIRQRKEWKKLPVIMLTAKAMKDDQQRCLDAGASDYMAKPIDVEKLLSLVRVWMPR